MAAGCSSSTEEAQAPPADADAAAVSAASDNSAPAADAAPAPAAEVASPTQVVATQPAFTPPFPNRLDLFEPPKRAQGTVRRDEESGATVELKGFINVNGPRVLLSIDNVIAPIAEGEEKYGVKVLSIDAPSVVLQRGRNRLTLKLE
ncbi:MAG: hypothetical protein WD669_11750 [Pirellulales bacterium]